MTIESDRIRSVYAKRDDKKHLYVWHRPEIIYQEGEKNAVIAALLSKNHSFDLSESRVLDVGCGTGGFLRTLVEWGADPSNLVGTEFLKDRLEEARKISPSEISFIHGDLSLFNDNSFDLISANTVFSSVLDLNIRDFLASEIWRVLKPGGWLFVFDFRYNNPSNNNVRKVTRKELTGFWKEGANIRYKTLMLAPPLARRIIPLSPLLGSLLIRLFPFLRSHFCFMLQKPNLV